MKLFLLVCVLLVGCRVLAQEKEDGSYFEFSFSGAPVEKVIAEIEKQSGYTFSYESVLLKDFPAITLQMKSFSLANVLEKVFTAHGVSYKIVKKYIVLRKRKPFFVVSGTVRDSSSRETLIQASVYDGKQRLGTTTNNHGFYSLSLPGGKVQLTISFVGYKSFQKEFVLQKDTVISVALAQDNRLQEVAVKGISAPRWVKNVQPGQVQFPVKVVNAMPSLLGETDLLKTIQLMPGVKTGSEGMAGLYVRGGNVDENLYLMDGVPIYNPSHLLGFFSTFNSDAVKNVDFFKSSFPARYGGRLSSVVDVRMKEGDMEEYHGSVSIGLIASKLYLEGPIWKNRTSFTLSARRTYVDLIASPLIRKLTKDDYYDNKSFQTGGYYFTDLNGKVTHKFSERNQISLSGYWGYDKVWYGDHEEIPYSKQYKLDGYKDDTEWKWGWGNFIMALEWGTRISSRVYCNTSVSYNRYLSEIDIDVSSREMTRTSSGVDSLTVDNQSWSRFQSGIYDWMFRSDFEYNLNDHHQVRFGVNYTYHTFVPETSRMEVAAQMTNWFPLKLNSDTKSRMHGNEIALYAEDAVRLTDRFRLNPGLRLALFKVEGKNYFSVEPRFSMQYDVTGWLSGKVSYSMMSQYIHLLAFGGISLPSDLWVPVSKEIKPMSSGQLSGGLYCRLGKGLDMSLEGYYKTMRHQIDYLDGASILPEYKNWKEHVAVGRGEAYGMEVQLQKSLGKTTGWINYTLAWANREFPRGEINYGMKYPAKYDCRHGVNIMFLHRFNKKFDISAAWIFHSGARATIALEKYTGGVIEGVNDNDFLQPEIEHVEYRNNYKMMDYHRLDLGFNFHRYRKRGVSTWSISLYNTYSRMNPFFVYTDTERRKNELMPVIKQASVFPIIPSFSYTFTF